MTPSDIKIKNSIDDNLEIISSYFNDKNSTIEKIKHIITSNISFQIKKINKLKTNFKNKIIDVSTYVKKITKSRYDSIKNYISSNIKNICIKCKCLKEFPNYIISQLNKIKKYLSLIKDKIINVFKNAIEYIIPIGNFLKNQFFKVIKITDNLLNKIPSNIWKTFKMIFSPLAKVLTWFKNIGVMALSYIWDGVKTIFSAGFFAIKTIATYAYKGTKFFFQWWFKMLVNTLLNPALWIINIPLFLLITYATFTAFSTVLATSISIIAPILNVSFDILKTVGSWIWSGISWVWDFVNKQYQGSFLQKIVNSVWNSIQDTEIYKSLSSYFSTIYDWGKSVFEWIQSSIVYKKIIDLFTSAKDLFFGEKSTKTSTLLRQILESIVDAPSKYIPEKFKDYIRSNFSAILPTKYGRGSLLSTLDTDIKQHNEKLAYNKLQLEILNLKKSDSTISPDRIDKILDSLYNQYAKEYELSPESYKKLAGDAFDKIINKNNTIIEDTSSIVKDLEYMKNQKSKILDGIITLNEEANEVIFNNIDKIISKKYETKNAISIDTEKEYQNIIENQKELQKNYNSMTTLSDLSFISTTSAIGTFQSIGSDLFYVAGVGHKLIGLDRIGENYFDASKQALENSKTWSYAERVQNAKNQIGKQLPVVKNKDGNIISDKILKLDDYGINYVQEKVKNIKYDMDKINKKDPINNITIIEDHNTHIESHELYTMSQLSKGLLRN